MGGSGFLSRFDMRRGGQGLLLRQQGSVVFGLFLLGGDVAQIHHIRHRAGERLRDALRHLDLAALLGHDRIMIHHKALAVAAAAVAAVVVEARERRPACRP